MRRREEGNGIGFSLFKSTFSHIDLHRGVTFQACCFDFPAACVYRCLHVVTFQFSLLPLLVLKDLIVLSLFLLFNASNWVLKMVLFWELNARICSTEAGDEQINRTNI
ncbi:hypothetical protein NMG60_11008601 [Bertholletia excelsa]